MEDPSMQIISAYISQIDSAMKISEILSEHSGEEDVSPDNLILGLIYRLMVPMTEEEMKSSVDVMQKIMNDEEEEEEEEGEEEEEINDIQKENEKKPRKIKTNQCNCGICMKARVCLINYPQYESSDIFSEKFRDSIQYTCDTHKLLLQ